MSETVTDVIVDAPADRVWQVLTAFAQYPDWNPLIRRVSGNLALDARLTVTLAASDGGERTTHPTVAYLRPGREIRWRERPALPGIMDTESGFKIEPLGSGQVRFVHWQASSGLLSPLLGAGGDSNLRERLEAMNLALKEQAERGAAHPVGQSVQREGMPTAGADEWQRVSARTL